ncbi:MAG TPA: pilus assembly protein TadG-related protein [Candidatus Limnocylindrales bacterium]
MKRETQRGQSLVLLVGGMLAFLAIAALAIDVSSMYSTRQTEKAAADAAALAGGQDLQVKGTRTVDGTQQQRARAHALEDVAGRFGVPTPACAPTADISDCPLGTTAYRVDISTPAKTTRWDAATKTFSQPGDLRTIQVTVRNPSFSLSFARIFGQSTWAVGETSVASIDYGEKYALVTLRPPNPLRTHDQNQDDIFVKGGTHLNVVGDIGTNSNVVPDNLSSVTLGDGFKVYYYDTYQYWTSPPPGEQIFAPIPDPNYPTPSRSGVLAAGEDTTGCTAQITKAVAAGYVGYASKDPGSAYTLTPSNTRCWHSGTYDATETSKINGAIKNDTAVLLEPGVHFFDNGFSPGGTVIGGYEAGKPGVSLVFPESVSNPFSGNNATLIALNAGSCINGDPLACTDWAAPTNGLGVDFVTPTGTLTVPESIIVFPKTPFCIVGATENPSCRSVNTVDLEGGGLWFLAGVQYGPTDDMKISGNSYGKGFVGQIVAYTVQYTGGSVITEVYPGGPGNGILHLDKRCSGLNTTCYP